MALKLTHHLPVELSGWLWRKAWNWYPLNGVNFNGLLLIYTPIDFLLKIHITTPSKIFPLFETFPLKGIYYDWNYYQEKWDQVTAIQCCNKSSHWLGLELTRVPIFYLTWLDSIFHLHVNDLTRVTCEMTLTWLWLDRMLTRVNEWLESPVKWLWLDSDSTACSLESTSDSSHDKWLESLQVTRVMTHTHSRISTWIMWSCEPWLCPHLI